MGQGKRVLAWIFILSGGVAIVLGACTPRYTAGNAPKSFVCAAGGKVEKDVAPEAGLEEFTCFFKKYEGASYLHFKVAVKNLSNKPQRYRVNIFLDDGKGVGGLIPDKTGKGLVKPGEKASFVYPVKGAVKQPKAVMLRIRPIEP